MDVDVSWKGVPFPSFVTCFVPFAAAKLHQCCGEAADVRRPSWSSAVWRPRLLPCRKCCSQVSPPCRAVHTLDWGLCCHLRAPTAVHLCSPCPCPFLCLHSMYDGMLLLLASMLLNFPSTLLNQALPEGNTDQPFSIKTYQAGFKAAQPESRKRVSPSPVSFYLCHCISSLHVSLHVDITHIMVCGVQASESSKRVSSSPVSL